MLRSLIGRSAEVAAAAPVAIAWQARLLVRFAVQGLARHTLRVDDVMSRQPNVEELGLLARPTHDGRAVDQIPDGNQAAAKEDSVMFGDDEVRIGRRSSSIAPALMRIGVTAPRQRIMLATGAVPASDTTSRSSI
jgi:hypothetical protein